MKKILNLCLRWHILQSYHFVAEVTFKCHTQRMERIDWISRCGTLYWIIWKKMSLKSNILEAHYSMKALVVAISSNIISFRFLPISGHLRTIEENQSRSIRSRRSSCNWGKKFSIISKGKIFRDDRKISVYR